jgi:hypothetical protein
MSIRSRGAIALGLLLILVAIVPATSAHGSGGPTTSSGSFVLGRYGSTTASADQAFASLGFSVAEGDVFQFTWTADDGNDLSVYFEIHRHLPTYVDYYNVTAPKDSGSWSVPGSDAYMVFWRNFNLESKTVSYSYVVNHGPDYLLEGGIALIVIGVAAGTFAVRSRLRARKERATGTAKRSAKEPEPEPSDNDSL